MARQGTPQAQRPPMPGERPCPDCNGRKISCDTCRGTGWVR